MMRGRKPTPVPRDDARPATTTAAALLDPPAELDTIEAAEWRRLVAILSEEQLAADTDQALLRAYCCSFGRWRRAHDQVAATGGEVVKSPNGFPIQNPWLSIANKAQQQMIQLASEFGLSPTSRARLRRVVQARRGVYAQEPSRLDHAA